MPFESAAPNPAQLLVHGPDTEDVHSTLAVLPGWRLTRRVCPLKLPTSWPDGIAQSLIKAASCTVASKLPSGEKAAATFMRFGLKVIKRRK